MTCKYDNSWETVLIDFILHTHILQVNLLEKLISVNPKKDGIIKIALRPLVYFKIWIECISIWSKTVYIVFRILVTIFIIRLLVPCVKLWMLMKVPALCNVLVNLHWILNETLILWFTVGFGCQFSDTDRSFTIFYLKHNYWIFGILKLYDFLFIYDRII